MSYAWSLAAARLRLICCAFTTGFVITSLAYRAAAAAAAIVDVKAPSNVAKRGRRLEMTAA